MNTVLQFLDHHQIDYQLYHHPPVFTVEEGKKQKIHIPGAHTKNLFLRNKEKTHFFLYSLPADKRADLKSLAKLLRVSRLSFASPDFLWQYLRLKPGSVSPFGLLHDKTCQVKFILDKALWEADLVGFHPNVNTATIVLKQTGFRHFLDLVDHQPYVLS